MSNNQFYKVLSGFEVFPILGPQSKTFKFIELDLSLDSPKLQDVDISSSEDLGRHIWNLLQKNRAQAAYGGYLERRGIYQRSDYFNELDALKERNIHLGLDIWIEAHTPIYAPLEGTIHSFKNNTNYGDYGPTLILRHQIEGYKFYTLYGHLSLESLTEKEIGQRIERGQQIATLGTDEVNGDYPPHLHFQIIRDIQDCKGDYPGVSNQLNLEFYKSNCPDPMLLLDLV
ncbi:peptidoglycan DD-metalloendopeptidase family protein [Winogradskyella sp. DF17]|uniref:Peptidoglycan DD-metalloendopeptidase family protein n=1 Tax=Winogradskyella pelagia TaxID=2819984 RepID=A0ABS3T1U2_9FLAO|nr:peptidoglycan DD-metalloendopeptidase family protein [Winogradskyella sp. DF17]MBO3116712.1 peptidoglycan DD-metalloendopeptidase family protein [Winogradskyella sp. DF17]